MKSEASLIVSVGIAGLALAVLGSFLWAVRRTAEPRTRDRVIALAGAGAIVWIALPAVLASRGILLEFQRRPPPALLMLAVLIVATVSIAVSPLGRRLATELPLWALVGVQGFRLPLELVMHRAATEGAMPVQMSFSGNNYDIVTGATAILLAVALYRGRASTAWAAAWNVLGFVLLVNIVTIALLSMPMVQFWGPEQVNTFALRFPYVWLPAILVQAALMGHLLILRRLLSDRVRITSYTITAR